MSRALLNGRIHSVLAATAVLALAACSEVPLPVQPSDIQPGDASSLAQLGDEGAVVAGEVIVKLQDGAPVDALVKNHGLGRGREGYGKKFDVVLTTRGNERAMAARLKSDPNVEYAEPNYLRQPHAIDGRLWAFFNPGGLNMRFAEPGQARDGTLLPTSYASLSDADEDAIEGIGAGGAQVTVGSIDTGVDFSHPEFTGRLIAGRDWFANDADPSDTPEEGHGTHTTGTMAGTNVGVAGVTGAAANVKIFVQRVCGTGGCPTSAIINSINAAADYRDAAGLPLVAVNFSIGGGIESQGEKDAILRLTQNGTLFIASAGNSGTSRVACPACDPNAISVASSARSPRATPAAPRAARRAAPTAG